ADRLGPVVRLARNGQPGHHLSQHLGVRRGNAAGHGHRAAARAALGHHRQGLQAGHLMRELLRPAFWGSAIAALVLIAGIPLVSEVYTLYNLTVFAVLAMLALSLGLVWGIGGILALGQSAFFGIGAYVYALLSVNLGDSTLAVPAAM